jgi:hypothetical protein
MMCFFWTRSREELEEVCNVGVVNSIVPLSVTKHDPSGEYDKSLTSSLLSRYTLLIRPDCRSHNRIVLSQDADARQLDGGEFATSLTDTDSVWPFSHFIEQPLRVSQMRIVQS